MVLITQQDLLNKIENILEKRNAKISTYRNFFDLIFVKHIKIKYN